MDSTVDRLPEVDGFLNAVWPEQVADSPCVARATEHPLMSLRVEEAGESTEDGQQPDDCNNS